MATLEITLKDGKFESTNMPVDILTDTYLKGLGWECYIFDNGKISCKATEFYNGEKVSMRYVLWPHGYARLTYKREWLAPMTKKNGYVVPKGVMIKDGVIGLSDGEIKNRFAFYRTETLQNALKKLGINKIRRQDPNKQYFIKNGCYFKGKNSMEIATDGICEQMFFSNGKTGIFEIEHPGEGYHETEEFIKVSDATWVLTTFRREDVKGVKEYKTLYTLKDIEEFDDFEGF